MALGDMEDDRACLEQGEIAFLVGRNLAERMKRQMCGFLQRTKRNQANLVWLARFFERQRTRVSRASPLPPSGDRSKAVMVMVIVKLLWRKSSARGPASTCRYLINSGLTQAQLARNVLQELVSTARQGREDGRKAETPMVSTTNLPRNSIIPSPGRPPEPRFA
jgi:hypothetical protein